jgi:hypothetical protein
VALPIAITIQVAIAIAKAMRRIKTTGSIRGSVLADWEEDKESLMQFLLI